MKEPWKTYWLLTEAGSAGIKGGWVVQDVIISVEGKKDNKEELKATEVFAATGNAEKIFDKSNRTQYWEAWHVSRKQKVDTGGFFTDIFWNGGKSAPWDDGIGIPSKSGFKGTDGKVTFTLVARYYDGLDLPESFIRPNPAAGAGGLHATREDPKFPAANATKEVKKELVISWNCCEGSESTRTIVSRNPAKG